MSQARRIHRWLLPIIDLGWVAVTPLLALYIRDNFTLVPERLDAIVPYTGLMVALAAVVFVLAGLNREIWTFASLAQMLRVIAAVTAVIILGVVATFVLNRLEGIARSIPVIQWFLLVTAMCGTRVAGRLLRDRLRTEAPAPAARAEAGVRNVLVVGLNHVTEFYLRCLAEIASDRISVVGILAEPELRGRIVQFHKVIGTPEGLGEVLARYEVHGVTIDRIVITEPRERMSGEAHEALAAFERDRGGTLDFFAERLGLLPPEEGGDAAREAPSHGTVAMNGAGAAPATSGFDADRPAAWHYVRLKRALDLIGALMLIVCLFPFAALVALLVALDVGLPLTFWQERPGLRGRPFKLYKFRTMGAAHDDAGARIPDEERVSRVGRFLRHSRLDELPQLYNILLGEMSFVGPRPLLPVDLASDARMRLSVRPGVTGWAQVNGGREVSVEDKDALDRWYVKNVSPVLDLKILARTAIMLTLGERAHTAAVRQAHRELAPLPAAPVQGGAATEMPAARAKEVA